MREDIENRCVSLAKYIVRTGATVRQAAGEFGISKSSVHKDMHERLRHIHPGLFSEVREILDYHHAVRHLRGGAATKQRWMMIKEKRNGGRSAGL
ncbi:MAG: sporulation transcriptional regulator SpoIIID [Clostridia bacterium]|nr:sporulation transcriptional regulator SpoIIID [Clostridia bacterium]